MLTYILKRPLKTPFGDKPLPGGTARIYNPDSDGRLQLVGEASFGHSAAGEDVSLYAGNSFDLTAKRVQTEYTTTPEKRGNVTRTIATLGFKVTALLEDKRRLEQIRENVRRIARPNAAFDVVDKVVRTLG